MPKAPLADVRCQGNRPPVSALAEYCQWHTKQTHNRQCHPAVTLDDGSELVGTPGHPIWSVDRGDWTALSDLQVGEALAGRDRLAIVTRVEVFASDEPVYNIEIHGEHVYEAAKRGILAHNSNPIDCKEVLRLRRAKLDGVATSAELADLAKLEKRIRELDYRSLLRGKPIPSQLLDPHVHHILFKKGLGEAQQRLVLDGMEILLKHGIDPLVGVENLVWASRRAKGQHATDALKKVVDELKALDSDPLADKSDFTRLLKKLGAVASARR